MYNISDSDFKIVENAASEFYSIRLLNGKIGMLFGRLFCIIDYYV